MASMVNTSETDAEVMCAVRNWVKETENAFFRPGFRDWPERWEKCVQAGGDWFEAYRLHSETSDL